MPTRRVLHRNTQSYGARANISSTSPYRPCRFYLHVRIRSAAIQARRDQHSNGKIHYDRCGINGKSNHENYLQRPNSRGRLRFQSNNSIMALTRGKTSGFRLNPRMSTRACMLECDVLKAESRTINSSASVTLGSHLPIFLSLSDHYFTYSGSTKGIRLPP